MPSMRAVGPVRGNAAAEDRSVDEVGLPPAKGILGRCIRRHMFSDDSDLSKQHACTVPGSATRRYEVVQTTWGNTSDRRGLWLLSNERGFLS